MCKAIGKMYELRAESALGIKARLSQLGFSGGDDMMHMIQGAARAVGAAAEMQKMAAQSASGGNPEANSREKMEAQMFDMMALDSTPASGSLEHLPRFAQMSSGVGPIVCNCVPLAVPPGRS